MIDRLGGQKRAAEKMDWSTSTVSRDCAGVTLPTDDRLRELANFLRLANNQRTELEVQLRLAREARQARLARQKNDPGSPEPEPVPHPDHGPGPEPEPAPRARISRRGWIIAAAVVVVLAATAGVLAWSPGGSAPAGVQGTWPGQGITAVSIPVASLTPPLAAAFRQGRTAHAASVTGFEFRNAQDSDLCLTAADTGPSAGRNRDQVKVAACQAATDQIWIPEQWETNGSAFTHLVSARYQKECLNAQKIGGTMRDGSKTMLWDCYRANNESWDFGDWYQNVKSGRNSYPILMHTDRFCLDASNTYGQIGEVDIRVQSATASQFWS